jgi:hypothetical protein
MIIFLDYGQWKYLCIWILLKHTPFYLLFPLSIIRCYSLSFILIFYLSYKQFIESFDSLQSKILIQYLFIHNQHNCFRRKTIYVLIDSLIENESLIVQYCSCFNYLLLWFVFRDQLTLNYVDDSWFQSGIGDHIFLFYLQEREKRSEFILLF